MYGFDVEKVNLKNEEEVKEVIDFLHSFNLKLDEDVDYTIIIRKDKKIKATCSKAKNVFKCFAVSDELQGEGVNITLMGTVSDKLFDEGIYHSFYSQRSKISVYLLR